LVLVQRRREAFQRYLGQIVAQADARKAVVVSKIYQPARAQPPKRTTS
jgi:hypothetical protein